MTRDSDTGDGGDGRIELTTRTSRRRFLEATGVAGLIGGVSGFGLAQQQSTTTFEFGGEVAGWQGRSPSAIEGETNPTLELEAGTEYEVVWENLDGQPHDFVLQDDQGNELVGTEIMSEQGTTQSFSFTASEEMAQYVCTVHPTTMVGDVETGSGGTPTDGSPQQGFVPEGPTVGAQRVADGPLVNPVTLRTVPGTDDTHVVVDQVGQVYLHQGGELRDEPFLDIGDRVMVLAETDGEFERSEGFDERGLLGLAFHPNYRENGRFYVRYSAPEPAGDGLVGPGDREFPDDWDHVEVLSEFRMAGDSAATADGNGTSTDDATATEDGASGAFRGDPESERVLLEVPEPQFNHNGGEVTFGPDGYLYTSLGDGGGANDTYLGHVDDWYDGNDGGNGQNVTENLLGTVLRIDVDGAGENTPYAVPEDNPLVGTAGMDEIWAWGLRNPWRMSFNDGQLVAADVGQALFEEVNVVERGGNYGWNVREGFHCFDAANATEPPDQCPSTAPDGSPFDGQDLIDPVLEYPHTYRGDAVGISITGGYSYEGDQLSDLSGRYVFGDWSAAFAEPQGRVFVATPGEQGDGTATDGTPTDEGTTTAANGTTTDQAAIGNVSVGQESGGDGNATDGATDTSVPSQEEIDIRRPSEQPWQYQEVLFEGGDGQRLNRFIQAFGRDAGGNVYVLASRTGRLTTEAGEVYRLVPAGDGDEISQPETATPTPGGETTTEAGSETPVDGGETATTTAETATEPAAGTDTATDGD